MSNKNNLINQEYTNNIIKLSEYNNTVSGFITQKNLGIKNFYI